MANTIRIIVGITMFVIASLGVIAMLYFTRGNLLGYFRSLDALKALLVIAVIPTVSAWLLLRPKNSTQAWIGMALALLYFGYFLVTQVF